MKEFKPLTESQLELLHVKNAVIQEVLKRAREVANQATDMQNKNMQRMERMKVELGIPEPEAKTWQLSKDGKNFEREVKIKKDIPGRNAGKGNKKKK